jgi:hypothetical protein
MAVNKVDCLIIGDTHMVWLNTDDRAKATVQGINVLGSFAFTANGHEPKTCELSREGRWNAS